MALNYIGKLYGIEQRNNTADVETRYQQRQRDSVPLLNQLRTWLDKTLTTVPPRGKLGEALQYLQKYWPKLILYTQRGDLPIDNNRAENAIRPFVIGRKNWLFSDTPQGANASAIIYSIIETATKSRRHEARLTDWSRMRICAKYLRTCLRRKRWKISKRCCRGVSPTRKAQKSHPWLTFAPEDSILDALILSTRGRLPNQPKPRLERISYLCGKIGCGLWSTYETHMKSVTYISGG